MVPGTCPSLVHRPPGVRPGGETPKGVRLCGSRKQVQPDCTSGSWWGNAEKGGARTITIPEEKQGLREGQGAASECGVWSQDAGLRLRARCPSGGFGTGLGQNAGGWKLPLSYYVVIGYSPQLSLSSWNVKFRLCIVGGLSALVAVNFLPSHLKLPDCQTIFFFLL